MANHFNHSGFFSPCKVQTSPRLEFSREKLDNVQTPLALRGSVIKYEYVGTIDSWCPRALARHPPREGGVMGPWGSLL